MKQYFHGSLSAYSVNPSKNGTRIFCFSFRERYSSLSFSGQMFKMSDKKSQSHSLAFFFLHVFKLCFYRSDFTTERVNCPVIQRLAVIRGSNCQKTWELDRTHHNCWLPVDAFEMLFYILATNNAVNKLWASN